jgi:hypothetical protein
MQFVPENIIDEVIERLEVKNHFDLAIQTLAEEQPYLMAYIRHENHSLLTNEEGLMLEFMATVIYESARISEGKVPTLQGSDIEEADETNWAIFNENSSKKFNAILDVFFKEYPQEDLLAFVEDTLQADEEQIVTPVGREILFIACKSVIDTLHEKTK